MLPDVDRRKAPRNTRELILADSEMRMARTVRVKLVSGAKRRSREVKVNLWHAEKMQDEAREIHGCVNVLERMTDEHTVGAVITVNGRPWTVAATCYREGCAMGWSRLEPIRLVTDEGLLPTPLFSDVRCRHGRKRFADGAALAPMGATVDAKRGDDGLIETYDRALSFRLRYVREMFAKADAAEAAGKTRQAAAQRNVAIRAENMTDDEWLIERKARG